MFITMLCRAGTTTPEARLHLALSVGSGRTFAALLPSEAAGVVPTPDVPGLDHSGDDDQHAGQHCRERNYREHPVGYSAEYAPQQS